MKKYLIVIIIIVSTIAIAFCSILGYNLIDSLTYNNTPIDKDAGGQDEIIIDTQKSIDECTEKECLYIMTGKLKSFISYYATISGKVVALGGLYTQNISCEKYKVNGNSFYETLSTSSLVSVCKQMYIDANNNVLVREKSSNNEWSNDLTHYNLQSYLNEYGVDFRELSNYTLNDTTILSASLKSKQNGVYVFTYQLDSDKATGGYRINIAKMGNMTKYPTILSSTLEVAMDSNFTPIYVKSIDKYKIREPLSLTCNAELIQTFVDINKDSITIPNESLFSSSLT